MHRVGDAKSSSAEVGEADPDEDASAESGPPMGAVPSETSEIGSGAAPQHTLASPRGQTGHGNGRRIWRTQGLRLVVTVKRLSSARQPRSLPGSRGKCGGRIRSRSESSTVTEGAPPGLLRVASPVEVGAVGPGVMGSTVVRDR